MYLIAVTVLRKLTSMTHMPAVAGRHVPEPVPQCADLFA